jgi:hypothetical protein
MPWDCHLGTSHALGVEVVRGHMMPTKTSVGPNEVVRLEVLRLAPPLLLTEAGASRKSVGPWELGTGNWLSGLKLSAEWGTRWWTRFACHWVKKVQSALCSEHRGDKAQSKT